MARAVEHFLKWWYGSVPKGPRVVRVTAFDEQDARLEYVRWDPEAFAGDAWVDHVRQVVGFQPGRLEIRLLFQGTRKRRVVLYPGSPCDPAFPPLARHIVVSATLVPSADDPDARPVDVTSRVQKYVGNSLRSPTHMFRRPRRIATPIPVHQSHRSRDVRRRRHLRRRGRKRGRRLSSAGVAGFGRTTPRPATRRDR